MGLTLSEIYTSTKSKYQLELVAGENGLNRIMNWVYISEDITTADFLQCGELIITTGVSSSTDGNWLYNFITRMIAHQTSGVIINTGQYIKEEDITDEIKQLCESHSFSLFTMPWNIHIHDITKDYYNRIFSETQADNTIATSLLNLIRQTGDSQSVLHTLEDYGFPLSGSYCISTMEYVDPERIDTANDRLRFRIESYLKEQHLTCHIAKIKTSFLFLWTDTPHEMIVHAMQELQQRIMNYTTENTLTAGIGSIVSSLAELPLSYSQSVAALTLARHRTVSLFDYEEMGFFKLLLSIKDPKLLATYVEQHLGTVIAYDKKHNSSYTETLHQYLLCNGSIQAIASSMFCHRNTINYRVHTLKETLSYNLDDPETRFHLMTSYLIRDYLKLLG